MDSARGYDDLRLEGDPADGGIGEPEIRVGTSERRMHVRAYNHWVSLLRDRPYPAIADLQPERLADFGPHSVLLDVSDGGGDPAIRFIGRALCDECGVEPSVTSIAQVPARSLLPRLTDHYRQIIADRAPIGFEAEFVGTRGHNTLYRGILLPFSSDAETIDYIYGVVNWKEMVLPEQQALLDAELTAAVEATPRHDPAPATIPAWADGPGASTAPGDLAGDDTLDERLAAARESAASARTATTRRLAALHRALGRAHDVALAAQASPQRLAAMLADAGIVAQPCEPLAAVVRLVFGNDAGSGDLDDAAAVLAFAMRERVPEGTLARVLELADGGVRRIVADERARCSAPARAPARTLAAPAVLADVAVNSGLADGAPVLLVGRASGDHVEVVGIVSDAPRLIEQALERIA